VAFDPNEFITVCRDLCRPESSQAEHRTAVGRALYGVFLWAREELESRGERVKVTALENKSQEHSKVRQRFKSGRFSHHGISQRLGGLYKLRWKSDYDLDVTIRYEDVVQALEYVDYIHDTFAQLHGSSQDQTTQ